MIKYDILFVDVVYNSFIEYCIIYFYCVKNVSQAIIIQLIINATNLYFIILIYNNLSTTSFSNRELSLASYKQIKHLSDFLYLFFILGGCNILIPFTKYATYKPKCYSGPFRALF